MQRVTTPLESTSAASTTWCLSWQAAVGRSFIPHPSLAPRIRDRLIDAHDRPGRALIAYTLLPTEIHAVSQVPEGDDVGGIARAFGNVVARWVRQAQPVRSPVLAGPFRALSIPSIEDLRNEARMLAWRPVFLGLCATPTHYPHAALRIALGHIPGKGFDVRPLLQAFGGSVIEARTSLRSWVKRRPSAEEWRAWELTHGLVLATGNAGAQASIARAVEGAAALLIAAGGTYGIEGALRLLEKWVAAKIGPTTVLDLHASSTPESARGRALVACLAVHFRVCSAASVARHFSKAKATLSEQMAACREREIDRQIVETPVQRVLDESAALAPAFSRRARK